MKYLKLINGYVSRSEKLLSNSDEVNLTYCALELRRAVELIVWTQFIDAFRLKLSNAGMYHFDYSHKLQSKSIVKMYELLKKHIRDYADYGSRKILITHSSSYAGPLVEDGNVCYIPPELPTSDYTYLSNILHYEKEIVPKKYKPTKKRLTEILNRIRFVKDNYTYRFLTVNRDVDKIIDNIKKSFALDDDSFRTFK